MPAIWEMVKEAVVSIGREASYSEIRAFIRNAYGEVNESSITCSIISSSVNHPSRIHYQENKKPRLSTGAHDFLFNVGRGRVAPYSPAEHGIWEIYDSGDGRGIRRVESSENLEIADEPDAGVEGALFALESHLRDFLAKNLATQVGFPKSLSVFVGEDGREGVEFQTDVGPIDILAVDESGQFYVLELKLGRGPDACLGQICRYMGWVKRHLAKERDVKGVIIAAEIPLKLKYAVTQVPNVSVMEYELVFNLRSAPLQT